MAVIKQINPGVCYVICDRPYRSFCRRSCLLWHPAAIARSHLRHCHTRSYYCKEPILPTWESREVSLEFFEEWTANEGHRRGLQRKGESSRDRNCQGQPLFSGSINLLSCLENRTQKLWVFSYFSLNTLPAQRHFSSNLLFSRYLKDQSSSAVV